MIRSFFAFVQLLHSAVEHIEKKATGQQGTLTLCCKNFDLIKLRFNSIEETLNVASSIDSLSTIGKKPFQVFNMWSSKLHLANSFKFRLYYFPCSDFLVHTILQKSKVWSLLMWHKIVTVVNYANKVTGKLYLVLTSLVEWCRALTSKFANFTLKEVNLEKQK